MIRFVVLPCFGLGLTVPMYIGNYCHSIRTIVCDGLLELNCTLNYTMLGFV